MNNSVINNVTLHQTVTRVKTFTLSLTAQIGLLLFLSTLVLWTVQYSSYPAVHDATHAIRHALYINACH